MSNSTNPILLQEKLEVLRLQHLGDSPTQISENIGRSADSVERILSQKGPITKCSSPNRSRKYLTLSNRLREICRVECGDSHNQICTDFNISIRTLQLIVQHKMKWKSQNDVHISQIMKTHQAHEVRTSKSTKPELLLFCV